MIALLTPTRGRFDSFKEMCQTAWFNADQPDRVMVVARFDEDDPRKYRGVQMDGRLVSVVGRRSILSGYWTECAQAADRAAILMQCADDIRFRTQGWDTLVRDAIYEDPWRYVYGRDGIADERMATHGFMHRRWYETLGYFTWPYFSSDYGDLWNHTIGERLGKLHYIEQLYTEHLHPAVGKAPMDETHRERIARDDGDVNQKLWEDVQPDLDHAVSLLEAAQASQRQRST